MRIYLLILAVIIMALGFVIPEVRARRAYARLKRKRGSEVTLADVLLAIEALRKDLWQVETVFFVLLLTILSFFF